MSNKYKIKGLKEDLSLYEAARIINKYRYNKVLKRIEKYLSDTSKEHLHELRIAIRRLRYSLENFRICYSKNEFLIIIEYTRFLQDLIGEIRDLDVLPEKIKDIVLENRISIPEQLYTAIEGRKERGRIKIHYELNKFLKNKTIQNFFVSN